jgi:ribose transport system ATP-binding protein
VRALSRARSYRAISFELRAGQVLGLAGAEASGRESLCRTLFGAEAPDSGEILIGSQAVQLAGPADAVERGIGYVPAERRAEGLIAGMSVRENMTLAQLGALCRGPVIAFARERALVTRWIERLRIRPGAPDTPAQHLSGGNQQKVVLAKWMIARKPVLLILDRPLRGLDVAARAEMIPLIRELAAGGIAIVLVADTLDELLALSDEILVMKDGAVSGRFPASAAKPTELQVLECMV